MRNDNFINYHFIDTMDKKFMSYLIGLLQTDGHLYENSRNRGKISLELRYKDKDIIKEISNHLDCNYSIRERSRKTNYKDDYKSISLTINDLDFRNKIKEWGMIPGKKSKEISIPNKNELDKLEYIRGLYDGDGSLGFTSEGFPFVSFVTQSEEIKNMLIDFIYEIGDKPKKQINRNRRDGIYNISIYKEDAVTFCKYIYPQNCISINRKSKLAQKIKSWTRPASMKKINMKNWTCDEDEFILKHNLKESCEKLKRSEASVKMRLRRIKKNKK